ncbi:MAG: exodeoxyribonuclease V subunit alpha [Thermodesulfobacteriota bacterium]
MSHHLLAELRDEGVLAPVDYHLALLLGRRLGAGPDEQLLAALVSHAARAGHSCLDRQQCLAGEAALAPYESLLAKIAWEPQKWRGVGEAGDYLPLIRQGQRLFLHRFFQLEATIAAHLSALRQRGAAGPVADEERLKLKEMLDRYFPAGPGEGSEIDWQKVAAALAVLQPLTIISGGPGTGKTSTVARLLAIILAVSPTPPRVAMVAPTGKAAMRLGQSLQRAQEGLAGTTIPTTAATIHRLLGVIPGSTSFCHGQDNPLAVDLVVVDEVSMIDVSLMASLLAALPPHARLILLGDKDQLASVKPGAVFADICGAGSTTGFSPRLAAELARLTGQRVTEESEAGPLTDNLVELRHSYRYPAASQLGQVASFVNKGGVEQALEVLSGPGDVRLLPLAELEAELARLARSWYGAYLDEEELPAIFTALDRFRILVATRRGPLGLANINSFVEEVLRSCGLIGPAGPGDHYHGRPIMIRHNDYGLGLFNGDVGVIRQGDDGQLHAFFPDGQGGFRSLHPGQLPAHDTVFAMTIHKSQGSEFAHLALLLPAECRHLSRELFYTGLTRARESATIVAGPQTVAATISRRLTRMSGLGRALGPR